MHNRTDFQDIACVKVSLWEAKCLSRIQGPGTLPVTEERFEQVQSVITHITPSPLGCDIMNVVQINDIEISGTVIVNSQIFNEILNKIYHYKHNLYSNRKDINSKK